MGKYSNLIQNAATAEGRVFFCFTSGKYSGGEFFLKTESQLVIGRDISSDVAIIDSKVSRRHARIWNTGGATLIEDMGSTNGSSVNGEPLKSGEKRQLKQGDTITIGDSSFKFLADKSGAGDSPIKIQPQMAIKQNTPQAMPGIKLDSPIRNENQAHDLQDDEDSDLKVNIGKISLQKQNVMASMAKTRFDGAVHANEGTFSKIEPFELIAMLMQAKSVGIIKASVTKPFAERFEIRIAQGGITGAISLSNRTFAPEKALSRLLLAKDGEYNFKETEEPRRESLHTGLNDIFTEIAQQRSQLVRYRKVVSTGLLRFQIPMNGKLSDLNKNELESLQFMINAQEVMLYLSIFPEHDEFILLSEILKYIDAGILFGDNNEEKKPAGDVSDDILDL